MINKSSSIRLEVGRRAPQTKRLGQEFYREAKSERVLLATV